MLQRRFRVFIEQVARHDQMPGHRVGGVLVEAEQLGADIRRKLLGLDLVRNVWAEVSWRLALIRAPGPGSLTALGAIAAALIRPARTCRTATAVIAPRA
ncbi:hypothetical protein NJBCHELONAE_23430 [Mycobacteroides chelonae]|nr:hypothetical protein NJBCHELONAE_23430 [Mycobacteroides chelonae]